MTTCDKVLARLPAGGPAELPSVFPDPVPPTADLEAAFLARHSALGGRVWSPDELRLAVTPETIVEPDAAELLGVDRQDGDPWSAPLAITAVRAAIAETGSTLLDSDGHRRLASLAPPRHALVIRRDQLVPSLEAAWAMIQARNTVLITGPSRTADIEGVLVRGIHGPAELIVCFVG